MTSDHSLQLIVPAAPEYAGVARLFVGAVGRHFELGEEAVADIKVAVSELCAGAAEDPAALPCMGIEIRPAADALEVDVAVRPGSQQGEPAGAPGAAAIPPAPGLVKLTGFANSSLRSALLEALFPDADYDPLAHRIRLRVPWELPAEPAEA